MGRAGHRAPADIDLHGLPVFSSGPCRSGNAEQHRARIALGGDAGRRIDAGQHDRLGMGAGRQPEANGFHRGPGQVCAARSRSTLAGVVQLEGLDQRRRGGAGAGLAA